MAANFRDKKPLRTYGIEWVATPFSFIPNVSDSTVSPLTTDVVGPVNVSWTATGLYHVAVKGGAPRAFLGGLVLNTSATGRYQIDATNVNATNGTFQIRAYTQATTTLVNFAATTAVQVVSGVLWQQASSYTR